MVLFNAIKRLRAETGKTILVEGLSATPLHYSEPVAEKIELSEDDILPDILIRVLRTQVTGINQVFQIKNYSQ